MTYKELKLETFGPLSGVLGFFTNMFITPCLAYHFLTENEAWMMWFILLVIQSFIIYGIFTGIIYVAEKINKEKTAKTIINSIRKSRVFIDRLFENPDQE